MGDRPLRADARRNRDRVLAAARHAFAERGYDVPLDDIAVAAGVGPGTVYRHFPTKEALFAAVSLANLRDLVEAARALHAATDPGAAFLSFLTRLAEEGAAKRDLPDALGGVGAGALGAARDELHAALALLLSRAQDVGAVRRDLTATDLLVILKALLHAVRADPDPAVRGRVFAVLRDGLSPKVG